MNFFKQMHCIIVDKENFSLASFREVVECLDDGKLVVIFPEGKLNDDSPNTVLAFKSGAVLMAHKASAPILPMYIIKREKWYHRQRIVVGQAIDIREILGKMPTMQQLNDMSDMLREKEIELREYYESLPAFKKFNSNK